MHKLETHCGQTNHLSYFIAYGQIKYSHETWHVSDCTSAYLIGFSTVNTPLNPLLLPVKTY